MIPMVDLKVQFHSLREEISAGLLDALEKTQFILGPNVEAFEREAAEFLGAKHAVAVASGTDALHLALLAAGVGPGDEVVTTPFTFIATAEAIRYVGATPVFVDIDPKTFNIDPAKIEAAVTSKTRAVCRSTSSASRGHGGDRRRPAGSTGFSSSRTARSPSAPTSAAG
jgi:dTDP-4-amino-4,6-dideoxygalactose transaminase